MSAGGRRVLPGERDELAEEAAFLRRSLEELEAERAAGELDGADYETLRARYEAQAEATERALREAVGPPPETQVPSAEPVARKPADGPSSGAAAGTKPSRPKGPAGWLASHRRRLVIGWSAAGCFAVAGCLVGLALAGVTPFARSDPATLSVASEIRIELGEAGVLASDHEVAQAVAVYDRVLELDPNQPEALADGGWLVRLAGISAKNHEVVVGGDAEIATAVKVAPGYALARAYDGIAVFEDDHSAAGAVAQFRRMLADKPSGALVASVAKVAAQAFGAAHVPVPAAFERPSSSSP